MHPLLEKLRQLGLVQISEHLFPPAQQAGEAAHCLSDHTPIWSYCSPRFSHPYDSSYRSTPLYNILPPTISVREVTQQTHFICLFGATSSSTTEELMQTETVKLVFEPDPEAMVRFIATQDMAQLIKHQFFFYVGDFLPSGWSLEDVIPPALPKLGFPVMYIQPGREEFSDYFEEMIRRIEFAYYRAQIYPAIGQASSRGTPFRPMTKGIFYDQEYHRIRNIMHTIRSGNPKYLKGTYQGPAVLLGAGPGLKRRPDLITHNALSITVNSAYGYCLQHNTFPDITIINDTSLDAAQSLLGYAGTNPNLLYGHWASGLGDEHFQQRYIGWECPELFGERPSLDGYGSVASAAFSLAEFMGAEEVVLTGFHLASQDPQGFNYATGETGKYYPKGAESNQLGTYRYPELYPVNGADGSTLYTTLNFMDAAMVMLERMQKSGMRIINTNADSLLFGENISVDPDYVPQPTPLPKPSALATVMRDPIDLAKVDEDIELCRVFYKEVLDSAQQILADSKPGRDVLALAEEKIALYDDNSFSYIMQRFATFQNSVFHKLFFGEKDHAMRTKGALYYFENAHQLARECITALNEQQTQLHQLIKEHGSMY